MARPIWNGHISFGLVTIPVTLYSAEKRSDIHFKLLDNRTKNRVYYKRINEKTGKEVPWENIVKGYEYDEDKYVLVNDKIIKAIAGENSKSIDIESFVNLKDLEYFLFEKPYYLVPGKKGEKGYVILRETLKATNKVGIAIVIIHTRQYLAALIPYKNTLILNLLRYPEEIIKLEEFEFPTATVKSYKITAKELDVAKQLVASMTSPWKPKNYHDEFLVAIGKYIDEEIVSGHKAKVKRYKKTTSRKSANDTSFVDLLKESISAKKNSKVKSSSSRKLVAKRKR